MNLGQSIVLFSGNRSAQSRQPRVPPARQLGRPRVGANLTLFHSRPSPAASSTCLSSLAL
eukprot:3063792-Amphidinium_carterae.1